MPENRRGTWTTQVVRLIAVGPADTVLVQAVPVASPPTRVRLDAVFGLEGPWGEQELEEILEDVDLLQIHRVGEDAAGVCRVRVLAALETERTVA